jgi:hypothetical protein
MAVFSHVLIVNEHFYLLKKLTLFIRTFLKISFID